MTKSQQVAFEPFGSLDGVLSGAPIKIMPVGVFYRGKRKIEITAEDLKQIATNLHAGLPRFRVPINENHAGTGKIGTVYDASYDPAGADGPGLYATRYELTDAGRKMVEEKRFDAVSPEMVWTKNGAKYQDPQTGVEHDNVLVGLALTERPFFGHSNVALFSDKPEMEAAAEQKTPWQRFKDLMAQAMRIMDDAATDTPKPEPSDSFRDYSAEQRESMAKSGQALSDGSYPIADGKDLANAIQAIGRAKDPAAAKAHIRKRAKALGLTDKLPSEWSEAESDETDKSSHTQEAEHMSNDNTPDAFTVKAEEFAALQAKAAQVDALKDQVEKFTTQLAETQTALAQTQRARALDQMIQHADTFTAIPGKPAEIGEKLLQLQEKDPELFKWFDGLLLTLDKQLTQSDLFAQRSSARSGDEAETLEDFAAALLKEKFNGDMAHYVDALKMAETQRPDLAKAYYTKGG